LKPSAHRRPRAIGQGAGIAMKLLEKLSYLGVVLPSFSSVFSGTASSPSESYDAVAPTGGLRVSMYRSWPANDDVLRGWSKLAQTAACGGVFQSPAWQNALARPFIRVGRYRLVAVQDGSALRGILPLQIGVGGILETAGEMVSDYLEPLVDPDDKLESWKLMLGMLHAQCVPQQLSVVLHNLPHDGDCRTTVTAIAAECGFAIQDEPSSNAARIPLNGSWENYLAALSGRDRKELKRKIKKATAETGARLTICDSGPTLQEDLQRALGFVEQAGGSKGIKARWTYRPIFKRASQELATSGLLKVYTLYLKDKPAAALIAFPSRDGPLAWAAGFDAETSKWSPGIVLFAMAMQDAIHTGAKHFDLLRGQSRYKNELGAVDFPLHRLTLKPL
jgi:CelD/BcsL family acetyltransferase involved in cellulose biosynthesis